MLIWVVLCVPYSSSFSPNSTGALTEARKALAETGDIENLRNENLALFKENQKLAEDLEVAKKQVSETQKSAKE